MRLLSAVTLGLAALCGVAPAAEPNAFRVLPYLQNPTRDGITIRWLSEKDDPGTFVVKSAAGETELRSAPLQTPTLAYNPFGPEPADRHATLPFLHSVRITGLAPGARHSYVLHQSGTKFSGEFKTAPESNQPIRFIVFADCETEPESSTTDPVDWPVLAKANRPPGITKYLANQTTGFQQNLKIIAQRQPDFLCIAGDLVESGGEQRDWDEFWRHLAGDYGQVASQIPVLPALGNHENFGGPGAFGGYSAAAANFAVDKFLTYFDVPTNRASQAKHVGRYYRFDFGPVSLIAVDSSDGLPHQTQSDTNHNLEGSHAPDFNPGSEQYKWLEQQLADAQRQSRFTFVQFHHTPFGSGPHSVPFGREGFSGQSGIAMRVLQPLFFRYGVDAVFCGHDETLERSLVDGREVRPDGQVTAHTIHFYDVGIGGDGLRAPVANFDNSFRKFLAHDDAPEVWENRRLVSGGKHYGHAEINVFRHESGKWTTRIELVHAFPLTDSEGQITGWERRVYDDTVEIQQ